MTGYKEVSLISKKGWNIHPYELPGVVEYYKAVGLILYWKLYGWSDITSCWSYPVLKALKQLQCCIFVFGVTISLAASLVMYTALRFEILYLYGLLLCSETKKRMIYESTVKVWCNQFCQLCMIEISVYALNKMHIIWCTETDCGMHIEMLKIIFNIYIFVWIV